MSLSDPCLAEERWALDGAVADRLLSPALLIRLDRVRRNVAAVLAAVGGPDRWRPHVKTSKVPEVLAELARAGLERFKCATPREADVLATVLEREGVPDGDVLVAYPLADPSLRRLGEVARAHAAVRFSVLCEDASAVASVPSEVGVFVDVNPGMDRTGAPIAGRERILAVARAAGHRLRGVHAYDGHRVERDREERRAGVRADCDALVELLDALAAEGVDVEEVVTAGTPSFPFAVEHAGLAGAGRPRHRVSPGTVVYHDARSAELLPDLDLEPAAVVLARVVSHPREGLVTCDAGSKSLAAEAGAPVAVVAGRPELVALAPSEEHLPLRVASGPPPPRGTPLVLVPRHVCPTVNLAEEAVLLDGDAPPRIVPVAARAHETRFVGG